MTTALLPVKHKPSRRKTLRNKGKGHVERTRAGVGGLPIWSLRLGGAQLRSWHAEAASRGLSTAEWLRRAAEHYKQCNEYDD